MLQGMAVVGGLSYPRSVQRGACAKGLADWCAASR